MFSNFTKPLLVIDGYEGYLRLIDMTFFFSIAPVGGMIRKVLCLAISNTSARAPISPCLDGDINGHLL